MKSLRITYTPSLVVKFTEQELELMMECSRRHYDMVCQWASRERIESGGNRPGFLRAMLNHFINTEGKAEHTLTFRELDTLAKILEISRYLSKEAGIAGMELGFILKGAMDALNNSVMEDKVP